METTSYLIVNGLFLYWKCTTAIGRGNIWTKQIIHLAIASFRSKKTHNNNNKSCISMIFHSAERNIIPIAMERVNESVGNQQYRIATDPLQVWLLQVKITYVEHKMWVAAADIVQMNRYNRIITFIIQVCTVYWHT